VRRSNVALAGVAALVVGAALLTLAVAGTGGRSTAGPCAPAGTVLPSVGRSQQTAASRVALRMPLVRQLLDGRPLNGVSVGAQTTRRGTLLGVQVDVRLAQPARVDDTWPWLLVDQTETLRPPYQIVRRRIRSNGVWAVTITVLAPSYRRSAVSGWVANPGSRATPVPGTNDRRPPQPDCG
jgi:hypothetical protein